MKPLNRVERSNAFLGFLLLFLVTIGIVVTVIFFSIDVPFSENERLKRKVLLMQNEKNLSDSFRVAMNEALDEMAKYDLKKESPTVTQRKVQFKIIKMGRLIGKMSGENPGEEKSIYNLVIQNLADLNDAKTKIRYLEEARN